MRYHAVHEHAFIKNLNVAKPLQVQHNHNVCRCINCNREECSILTPSPRGLCHLNALPQVQAMALQGRQTCALNTLRNTELWHFF